MLQRLNLTALETSLKKITLQKTRHINMINTPSLRNVKCVFLGFFFFFDDRQTAQETEVLPGQEENCFVLIDVVRLNGWFYNRLIH